MMSTGRTPPHFSRFKRFFREAASQSSRRRSQAGLLVAAILLPVLLGVLACMPVPVGDPEKSRVDPSMSGVWLTAINKEAPLMVLDPFDKRSWLATWFYLEDEAPGKPAEGDNSTLDEGGQAASGIELLREERVKFAGFGQFKGWLTQIEGERFLTLEPRLFEPGATADVWYVFRVRFDGENRLQLAFLSHNFEGLREVKTTAEAEELIRLNLENPDLFDDPWVYQRISQDDLEPIHSLIEEFGYDLDP